MFTKVKERKKYEEVIDQIKALLDASVVKYGELLPSVEDMANSMDVSKSTVREAVRVLEAMGLVQSIRGRGVVVTASNLVLDNMDLYDELNKFKENITYTQELNWILEPSVAKLVAQKNDQEGIRKLEENLKEMRLVINAQSDTKKSERLALEFHRIIMQMTKNPLMMEIFLHTRLIEKSHRIIMFDIPGREEEIYQEHKNIFEAIRDGKVEEAYQYSKLHLKNLRESFEKII